MDNDTDNLYYNEALILDELERRFYLYLIGGDYEKLFYTFEEDDQDNSDDTMRGMSRIRLEVEVTESERRNQSQESCADPEYKGMLDYMLKHRINAALEKEDLLGTSQEISDIIGFMRAFGSHTVFTDEILHAVQETSWLKEQIERFLAKDQILDMLQLTVGNNLAENLKVLGYPLFTWLLPRWCGEVMYKRIHPSLRATFNRMRQYSRFISGAIATLAVRQNISKKDKWMLYMLSAINMIPIILLLNIVNDELLKLLEQQKHGLSDAKQSDPKLNVLETFTFAGDGLRDIFSLDEILKPHILESIGFTHFDPLPYLLGYQENEQVAAIFFQARAYALYRQLFKTGRIHPHETAVFLKKYKINKPLLALLNEADLTALSTHIKLHNQLLGV